MSINDINTWQNFTNWQAVTPPSRPADWQLDLIKRELLSFHKESKIAILGSTIEFRNLLAEIGYKNIFIFERNQSFYDYITKFAKYELNETIVSGNWLDTLKEFKQFFDIILSDLTSGNIPYERRNDFYRSISNALLPSGIYIDRILTKSLPLIQLEHLISKYEKMEVTNQSVNSFNCEVLFCSTLLDNENHMVDTNVFYDYLLSLNNGRISEFVMACYEITPRDCVWWYNMDWKVESDLYQRYFKIRKEFADPPDSEYYIRAKLLISERR